MTTETLTTHGPLETEAVGEAIGSLLELGDVVVLNGDLGTGKTTMTRGLARGLGVTQRVTSPTFTIVQEYEGRLPFAHVDVYRLERIQELHDFGFEELLDARVTIVEWGEAISPVLPRDRVDIRISMVDDPPTAEGPTGDGDGTDDRRVLVVAAEGPSWSERRAALRNALAGIGRA